MAVLIIPPLTAHAASVTSRSFVVRNTPAAPLDLFALPAEQLSTEPPAPAVPTSTEPPTLASTEEVVMGEQDETGEEKPEEVGQGEEIEPGEEAAETRDRSDKLMDEPGEPEAPADMFISSELGSVPTTPAFTDEIESEETGEQGEPEGEEPEERGEFVGEVEGQDGAIEQVVDYHSWEEDELR